MLPKTHLAHAKTYEPSFWLVTSNVSEDAFESTEAPRAKLSIGFDARVDLLDVDPGGGDADGLSGFVVAGTLTVLGGRPLFRLICDTCIEESDTPTSVTT